MLAKLGVMALVLSSAIFLLAMVLFGWAFLSSGQPLGIGLGIGVLLLMLLCAWVIWWELRFGMRSAKLQRQAAVAGISGQADEVQIAKLQAQFTESDWQYHYLQAVKCESMRNRKGARQAVNQALQLLP